MDSISTGARIGYGVAQGVSGGQFGRLIGGRYRQRTGTFGSAPARVVGSASRLTGSANSSTNMGGVGRKRKRDDAAPARKKRKGATRDKRKKRLDKHIKNVVDRKLLCQENVGIYTKTYTGNVHTSISAGDKIVLAGHRRLNAHAGIYTQYSMAFTPFAQKRVLDAASVLYNGKAPGVDIDASGNFAFKGLKVDLIYGSYQLELLNATTCPVKMECWEFKAKASLDSTVLANAVEMFNADKYVGGAAGRPQFAIGTAGFDTDYYMTEGLDFGMIKALKGRYSFERVKSQVVAPGKIMKYFTKHKGCYDFNKNLSTAAAPAEAELASFAKGETQVIVTIQYMPHLQRDSTGFIWGQGSGTGDASHGILSRVKEVYKIFEPEVTSSANSGDQRCHHTDVPTLIGAGSASEFFDTGPDYTLSSAVFS